MPEERIITVNFRPVLQKPVSKRRRAAVSFLREQIVRHTKAKVVSISKAVADLLIKVPRRIKVKVTIAEGRATVGLI